MAEAAASALTRRSPRSGARARLRTVIDTREPAFERPAIESINHRCTISSIVIV